jgi:hypothetical protein
MATNLGMVGVVNNASNCYLQSYSGGNNDGETHCSNPHRNTEETWFLIEIDKERHLYSLLNFANQKYLSKFTNGQPCATAKGDQITSTETTWILMSGVPFGLPNCVAFRSAFDRTVLGANDPGSDSPCGGEVMARDVVDPINHADWPGWWRIDPADYPTTGGQDFWKGVGNFFGGVAVNLVEAAVVEIIADIAAAPAS